MKASFVLPFLFLGIVVSPTSLVMAQPAGTFTATGSMIAARAGHSATLLPDGKVLIAGGYQKAGVLLLALASAELYDPSSGTFTATGSMVTARGVHTATLLADGRVLIAGGFASFGSGVALTNAELYDRSAGTFTAMGDMAAARQWHTATLLNNGKVLIAGGYSSGNRIDLASAELYDPSTGTFSATSDMTTSRSHHTATLFPNGKVLIEGGFPAGGPADASSAEIYDPGAGAFSLTASAPDGRISATASLLTNGKVLLTLYDPWECGADFSCDTSNGAELYDPSTGAFTITGNMTADRSIRTATLLPDGTVLIAGGGDSPLGNLIYAWYRISGAELYDPAAGTFAPTGHMTAGRTNHTATLLPDGTVLIAGGAGVTPDPGPFEATPTLASAELYRPAALVPAPVLFSLSQDGRGQGAILQAGTPRIVSPSDPAVVGEYLEIYCTGLVDGSVIPPQVAMGGRMAEVLFFGKAPGFAGLNQVNVRVPSGVASGDAVPLRLTYIGRSSSEVTIAVR